MKRLSKKDISAYKSRVTSRKNFKILLIKIEHVSQLFFSYPAIIRFCYFSRVYLPINWFSKDFNCCGFAEFMYSCLTKSAISMGVLQVAKKYSRRTLICNITTTVIMLFIIIVAVTVFASIDLTKCLGSPRSSGDRSDSTQ